MTKSEPKNKPLTGKSPAGTDSRPSGDISLNVVEEGKGRFQITGASSTVERIGELLRGKTRFSWWNSVVIPASAVVLTTLLTTLVGSTFQYISWRNSIRLDAAKDIASKAETTYNQVEQAINDRAHATLFVIPAMRDLASRAGESPKGLAESIYDLDRQRVASYYTTLAAWNNGYDNFVTSIDYELDRPIFIQAGLVQELKPISAVRTNVVDCTKALPEQVDKTGYNKHSLKVQFAIIARCFISVHGEINTLKDKILREEKVADADADKITRQLGDAATMGNVFRCNALYRIEFYGTEREHAIWRPTTLVTFPLDFLFNWPAERATDHFGAADAACNVPRK